MYIQHAYNRRMSSIRFEWDPQRAEVNLRKHRVSFEDAQSVFSDERALLIDDPDHSEDAERLVLLPLAKAFACSSLSTVSEPRAVSFESSPRARQTRKNDPTTDR